MSWADHFFGSKYYLKTHLPVLTDEKTRSEVDFIYRAMELSENSEILDLPCGHGRHSILLSDYGYKVTGIDNQPEFIEIAKNNSKNENVQFFLGDMREIDFEGKYDAVLNLFTSFGYFSENDNFEFLKKMIKALKIGGKLMIDTVNRERTMQSTGELNQAWLVYPPDNITFLVNNTFDIFTSRMYSEQVIIDNGEKFQQNQDIRLYSFTEINMYLKILGMQVKSIFGGMNGSEYNIDSPNMVIIAEKVK